MVFADSFIAGNDDFDRTAITYSQNYNFERLDEDNFAWRACYVLVDRKFRLYLQLCCHLNFVSCGSHCAVNCIAISQHTTI